MIKVDSTSIIEEGASIGDNTKIWQFCVILSGASIGENCNIGQGCFVEGGAVIGDNCRIKNNISMYSGVICEEGVFLGPNCVFTNVINPRAEFEKKDQFQKTILKRGATVGANSTIVCGNTIGEYAMVGAGSVVTKSVPAYELWYGNPARHHGYVCKCGEKLFSNGTDKYTCEKCGCLYAVRDGRLESTGE